MVILTFIKRLYSPFYYFSAALVNMGLFIDYEAIFVDFQFKGNVEGFRRFEKVVSVF